MQARPQVRSIGVQVELKKVVVWVIKFCDWFERYNERRFGEGFFTWRLRALAVAVEAAEFSVPLQS